MKQLVRIYYESDFTINNSLPNGYDNEDFIIRLYTTDESSYYEAKYIDGTSYNCTLDLDNNQVIIYVNNHGLDAGCLHLSQMYDYDNNHFADGIENLRDVEETNIYLVKQNASATSAMWVGSNLPDLTGSADFITYSDLMAELTDYVTDEDLDEALNSYATESYVAEYVAAYGGNVDLSDYVTYSYLEGKNYADSSDLGRKQDMLINGVNIKTINGYGLIGAGNIEITSSGTVDLSAYVTKDELSQASYVTETSLSNMSYVTEQALSQASYITNSDLISYEYVTQEQLTTDLDNYITEEEISEYGFLTDQDITAMGYATETYVAEYVSQYAPSVDLSSYVTKTELSNAGYVTETSLSNMGYVTESQLQQAGYLTSIPAEYVTATELSQASYVTEQALSQAGYLTSIPAEYVTETELSNAGYISSIPAEYVTESELSAKSYATTSQLAGKQDTLVSGTNIKTINNNSVLGSGNITITSSGNLIAEVTQAEYNAMVQAGTLDPNTLYVITDAPATDLSYYAELSYVETYYVAKTAFIYNSSTYTLTINI